MGFSYPWFPGGSRGFKRLNRFIKQVLHTKVREFKRFNRVNKGYTRGRTEIYQVRVEEVVFVTRAFMGDEGDAIPAVKVIGKHQKLVGGFF